MKIKILRYAGIVGFLLLIATLIVYLTLGFFLPPILVSREFATVEHFLALAGAILIGLCFIFAQIANILRASKVPSKKKLFKYISKQIWISLPVIFSAVFFGYLMYIALIHVPASLLHTIAPKESVQLDAIANSAWHTKDLRKNCQYHLLFDVPEISSEIQYVCMDENQWLELRGADYPMTIHLEGQKSYYGYELRYTK